MVVTDIPIFAGAVRRYEKKEALHSAQTESRILEINERLNDVLTLAAAAATAPQRPGLLAELFERVTGVVWVPFEVVWRMACFPRTVVGMLSSSAGGRFMTTAI